MDCLSDKTIFQVWHTGTRVNLIRSSKNYYQQRRDGQDNNIITKVPYHLLTSDAGLL